MNYSSSLFWFLPILFASTIYGLAPFHEVANATLADSWYIVGLRSYYNLDSHLEYIGKHRSADISTISPINAINGYSARFSSQLLHDVIRHDPGVKYIQQDYYLEEGPMSLEVMEPPGTISRILRRWAKHKVNPMPWFVRMLTNGGAISPTPVQNGPGVCGKNQKAL